MGTIRRSELEGAVRAGILSAAQADRLVAFLEGGATQLCGFLPGPMRELIEARAVK